MSAKELGEKIKAMRKAKGLTQDELGAHVSLCQSAVCLVEKGRQNLTLLEAIKMCKALGSSLLEFER